MSPRFVASLTLALGLAAPTLAAPPGEGLDDEAITNAIESELLLSDAVASHKIDTEVNEGVAHLSGAVDNLLAKRRAVELARTIKGVRSVVDTIQVDPPAMTDEALAQHVEDALLYDPATESFEVAVFVEDAAVRLTGEVDSYQEKVLAGEVAAGVRGVKSVDNDIDFTYDASRTDGEIAAEIDRWIDASAWIDDNLIEVRVEDGRVALEGTVGSAAERRWAHNRAWVPGVMSVDASGLEVEWWAHDADRRDSRYADLSDAAVQGAIEKAFLYDPRVLSFNPQVGVEDGIATLTGTVSNFAAKRAAEQVASDTIGVWRVKNFLRVRAAEGDAMPEDAEIRTAIRSALLRDPYVSRDDVTMSVINGHVNLYGTVDTDYERDRAQTLAENAAGVVDVDNYVHAERDFTYSRDWEIEDDIRSELFWSPFVDQDQVDVTVRDGVATLRGEVDTWSEWLSAEENAREGGAKRVVNLLDVDYGPDLMGDSK